MPRIAPIRLFLLFLTFSMCHSLGSLDLRLTSEEPMRMFICIGPDCLLGRRYIYLESNEPTNAEFNITGGEWQKNFTVAFQLTTKQEEGKEIRFDETWRGNVTSGNDWQAVKTSPIRILMRFTCAQNIYGPQCKVFCKPSSGLVGHFTCDSKGDRICNEGWTGIHCTKPDCPSGCGNGTCISPGVCRCQFGFKGNSCQECMPHRNCLHGTCADNIPGTCSCNSNWAGRNCDKAKDYCAVFNPCKNGGTCINGKKGTHGPMDYICECPNGFGGSHCNDSTLDHICDNGKHVCLNGGKCIKDKNSSRCACPERYSGKNCEIAKNSPRCKPDTCSNGGSCLSRGGVAACVCPPCFSGSRCEVAVCVGNTTVSFSSPSSSLSKTGETLALGICLLLAVSGTVVLGYFVFYQKVKSLLLVNSVMTETSVGQFDRRSSPDRATVYKVCPRSAFEAPPPYTSTLTDEIQPTLFKETTLSTTSTRLSKLTRIPTDNGVIV